MHKCIKRVAKIVMSQEGAWTSATFSPQRLAIVIRYWQHFGRADSVGIAKVGFIKNEYIAGNIVTFNLVIASCDLYWCRPKQGFLK
jgi:hypothetical protein